MALTKISTDGVKDDAITKAKIPANQIEASELADNAVDTDAIADQAVALSKLPHGDSNNNGKFLRANNGADPSFETIAQPDLTNLSASNLTSGTIPDARLPATLPAISGANLTNLPPNRVNRNLIINGAFQINQRGVTGHGSSGYRTVDRWTMSAGGLNAAMHQYQVDINAGDLAYTKGFRKMYRLTNDGQTPDGADFVQIVQHIEAQNIATSGWNYVSSSNNITLSFYVRASVSQTYHGYLQTQDGTNKTNSFSFALTANTWTKVTKTFSGDSGITINNDNGVGLTLHFTPFMGTNYTASSVTDGTWQTYASGARTTDQTSTWMTTAYSTFEITGVQLEVGSVATDFEHRLFGQELQLCQRYCFVVTGNDEDSLFSGYATDNSTFYWIVNFPTPMRVYPTYTGSSSDGRFSAANTGADFNWSSNVFTFNNATTPNPSSMWFGVDSSGISGGQGGRVVPQNGACTLIYSAEL